MPLLGLRMWVPLSAGSQHVRLCACECGSVLQVSVAMCSGWCGRCSTRMCNSLVVSKIRPIDLTCIVATESIIVTLAIQYNRQKARLSRCVFVCFWWCRWWAIGLWWYPKPISVLVHTSVAVALTLCARMWGTSRMMGSIASNPHECVEHVEGDIQTIFEQVCKHNTVHMLHMLYTHIVDVCEIMRASWSSRFGCGIVLALCVGCKSLGPMMMWCEHEWTSFECWCADLSLNWTPQLAHGWNGRIELENSTMETVEFCHESNFVLVMLMDWNTVVDLFCRK